MVRSVRVPVLNQGSGGRTPQSSSHFDTAGRRLVLEEQISSNRSETRWLGQREPNRGFGDE